MAPRPQILAIIADSRVSNWLRDELGDEFALTIALTVPASPGSIPQLIIVLVPEGAGGVRLVRDIQSHPILGRSALLVLVPQADAGLRAQLWSLEVTEQVVMPASGIELRTRVTNLLALLEAQHVLAGSSQKQHESLAQRVSRLALEHQQAETEILMLRQSMARLRAVAELEVIGILFWQTDGTITYANDAFLRIIDYTRDEFRAGQVRWRDLTPPEYAELDEAALAEMRMRGACSPFEKEYFRKDGSRVAVLIGANMVRSAEQEGVAFVLDISDRKNMEHDRDRLSHERLMLLASVGEATEALRHSEERFRTMFEQSPLSIQFYDAQGTILQANRAWEEVWGAPVAALRGYNVLADPQIEMLGLKPYFEAAFVGEVVVTPTFRYDPETTGREGRPRWVQAYLYPIKDEAGTIREVVLILQDVTERREAEEGLQETEMRFRQLTENIDSVFWMSDIATRNLLYVSPAFERIWGRSRAALEGEANAFLKAIYQDDVQLATQAFEAQERGEYTDVEYRIVRPDGMIRWVWDRSFPIADEHGKIYRRAGIAEDITERKQAEEAQNFLAEASNILVSSLDDEETLPNLAWLVISTLAEWCAIDVAAAEGAPRLLALAGPGLPAVETRQVEDPLPPPLGHVIATGQPICVSPAPPAVLSIFERSPRLQRRPPEGAESSAMIVPIMARGQTLGVISCLTTNSTKPYSQLDLALIEELARRMALVLDNARLYHEAREAVHARDEFLSIASHELKTPITTVRGYAELLRRRVSRDPNANPRDQRALETLYDQTIRLHTMIETMLDIARIQTDQLTIERHPLALNALILQLAEAMQPTFSDHIIEVEGADNPVQVNGDELRLRQAIQNLIINAIKYSPAGRRITLRLASRYGWAMIAVIDEGIGIPADSIPHLFDRFYRAPNVVPQEVSGMGLGLYLVKRIVTLHGGTIEVTSREGEGSTFTILLPRLT